MMQQNSNSSNTGWREVRLFISSTFRDMHAERDYLVRFVFPKIREELLRRHVYFVDVDLRWGLTAEDDVVGACRSIINECRPLFLGILGGRYGWVPKHLETNVSVTEDEIDHAMKNFKNGDYQRLYFLFRDEAATLSMQETVPGEYIEPPLSENSRKLGMLKQRIKESGFDHATYGAAWDETSGSLTHLHHFGDLVYDFIHSYIEEAFGPETSDSLSPTEEDDAVTDQFIHQKNRFFITEGLEDSLKAVETAAAQHKKDNVILVTGPCGIGKSAFLCKYIENAAADPNTQIIPHFIGVTAQSSELGGTLRRLCHLLSRESSLQESVPYELDKLILYFQRLLTSLDSSKKYIVLIDGLNQLLSFYSAHELRWLPQSLPPHVTLLVSVNTETMAETLRSRWTDLYEIELKGMNQSASRSMVDYYLSRYQKRLSPAQIQCLLSKRGAHIPLYLSTVIEEMRIFGSYEGLLDFIESLPHETVSLLEWIINTRISSSKEFTDDQGQLVGQWLSRRYLSCLYISQTGLSEAELTEILGTAAVHGNVAALTRQLRAFLTHRGEFLTFYHDDIKTAIYNCFIAHADIPRLHEELADYFHKKADPDSNGSWRSPSVRHFQQLFYHRLNTGNYSAVDKLVTSGFLDSYIKLGIPVVLMQDIRAIVNFLSDDPGNDHWDAILHCLKSFYELSKLVINPTFDQPHPMENALAEGRDNDVFTLLDSSSRGFRSAALKCAARTLYTVMGKEEKAHTVESEDVKEVEEKGTPLPLLLLYRALTGPQPKSDAEEFNPSDNEEKAAGPSEDQNSKENNPHSPHAGIPISHIFFLTAIGSQRFMYGLSSGVILLGLAMFLFSPLYGYLEQLRTWSVQYALFGKALVYIVTILLGLPVALLPIFAVQALRDTFTKHLQNTARTQILRMVSAICSLPEDKRFTPLLRLARYTRLLLEAEIKESKWHETSMNDLFNEEVIALSLQQRFKEAGLLSACIMNSGTRVRASLSEALRSLPRDMLLEVILSMLEHKEVIKLKNDAFDFILEVYGNTPPVAILLEALTQQKYDDREKLIKGLQKIDKNILASCLLRSMRIEEPTKVRKLLHWNKAKVRVYLFVEPISHSGAELLVKSPFLLGLALAITVILYLGLIVVLMILVIGVIPFLLWSVFRDWDEKKKLPEDVHTYRESLLSDGDAGKSSNKQLDPLHCSAAVETALAHGLAAGKIDPKSILRKFSPPVIVKVWNCILRPGFSSHRGKLLSSLLHASEVLPKVLKKVSSLDNRNQYIPSELSHKKQWDRMTLDVPYWKSSLQLVLTSFFLFVCGMTLLYTFAEPWTASYLMNRWWLPLLPILFAGLVPYTIVRYIPFVLIFLLSLTLWDNLTLMFFYTLLPALSLAAANEVLKQWNCSSCLYPSTGRRILGKANALTMILAGILVVWGLGCFFSKDDIVFGSMTTAKEALYNYATIKKMPDSLPSLDTEKWVQLPYSSFMNQRHLYRHVVIGMKIYGTRQALAQFGYSREAEECRSQLMSCVGWSDVKVTGSSQNSSTVFTDMDGNEVPIAVVITSVVSGSPAKSLGIKAGDSFVSIGGTKITALEDVSRLLKQNYGKGSPFSVVIRRKNTQMEFSAFTEKLGVALGAMSETYLDSFSRTMRD